jgi:threonine dehydratase
VIAASAGNHAQGLAHHAQRLGLRAVIVMPELTPAVKVERTRGFGAEVLLHGQTFDEAHERALQLAAQEGLVFVHPFDDLDVMAGQGTVALEMLQAQPEIDTLVVAVGGGGLLSGMATVARALRPDIRIVGVQSERFASMVNAVTGSTHPIGTSSIAEGIAVGRAGHLTRAIAGALVDEWMLVNEGDIEQAILMLLEIEKTVVEGAGAAGLAALLKAPPWLKGRHVGLVLCGGNIDPLRLQALIGRGMVRAGRLARVRVEARDAPGALAQLTTAVAQCGANIEEVHHQRAFSALPVQHVEIELVLQTRNHAKVPRRRGGARKLGAARRFSPDAMRTPVRARYPTRTGITRLACGTCAGAGSGVRPCQASSSACHCARAVTRLASLTGPKPRTCCTTSASRRARARLSGRSAGSSSTVISAS